MYYEDFALAHVVVDVQAWILAMLLRCVNEITTEEMVNKNHDVLEACWVKIHEIAKMVYISDEGGFNIMHEQLSMRKLSPRRYYVCSKLTINGIALITQGSFWGVDETWI